MTTQIYTQDISIHLDYKLVGGISPNINLKNTGTATLDAMLIFSLVQHVGLENEATTVFQCWVSKEIVPNQEINISGMYFLDDGNTNLILSELNGDSQTLRLAIEVTGGTSEEDRTALVKQSYPDMSDYSLAEGKV